MQYQLIVKNPSFGTMLNFATLLQNEKNYIFVGVNNRTYIQKPIAALLAGMFLFIYILQGFHSHSSDTINSAKHQHSKSEHVLITEKSSKCLICEFQLAKDGLPVHNVDLSSIAAPSFEHAATKLTEILSETSLLFEGRGPPAI